jgi:hypothetical protein
MESNAINSREDLDAIADTEKHYQFVKMLEGSIFRIEKDNAAKQWTVIEDVSTIEKFGFVREDFPDAQHPEIPEWRDDPEPFRE